MYSKEETFKGVLNTFMLRKKAAESHFIYKEDAFKAYEELFNQRIDKLLEESNFINMIKYVKAKPETLTRIAIAITEKIINFENENYLKLDKIKMLGVASWINSNDFSLSEKEKFDEISKFN